MNSLNKAGDKEEIIPGLTAISRMKQIGSEIYKSTPNLEKGNLLTPLPLYFRFAKVFNVHFHVANGP